MPQGPIEYYLGKYVGISEDMTKWKIPLINIIDRWTNLYYLQFGRKENGEIKEWFIIPKNDIKKRVKFLKTGDKKYLPENWQDYNFSYGDSIDKYVEQMEKKFKQKDPNFKGIIVR